MLIHVNVSKLINSKLTKLITVMLLYDLMDRYTPAWKDQERLSSVVNPLKRQKTLHTLIKYASDMMIRLQIINVEKDLDFHLRVGKFCSCNNSFI